MNQNWLWCDHHALCGIHFLRSSCEDETGRRVLLKALDFPWGMFLTKIRFSWPVAARAGLVPQISVGVRGWDGVQQFIVLCLWSAKTHKWEFELDETWSMSSYTSWWISCLCNENSWVRSKWHYDRSWCNFLFFCWEHVLWYKIR